MKTLRVRHQPGRVGMILLLALGSLLALPMVNAAGTAPGDGQAAVSLTLDDFHRAAANADSGAYFATLTDNVVFLGTDASERWQGQDFREFVSRHFDAGEGWTYRTVQRDIDIAPDGATAWFDELLENDVLGTCRGSGVMVKTAAGWKITQYNLSIPVPNALAAQVATEIAALQSAPADSSPTGAVVVPSANASAGAESPAPAAAAEAETASPSYNCSKKRFKTNTKAGC